MSRYSRIAVLAAGPADPQIPREDINITGREPALPTGGRPALEREIEKFREEQRKKGRETTWDYLPPKGDTAFGGVVEPEIHMLAPASGMSREEAVKLNEEAHGLWKGLEKRYPGSHVFHMGAHDEQQGEKDPMVVWADEPWFVVSQRHLGPGPRDEKIPGALFGAYRKTEGDTK